MVAAVQREQLAFLAYNPSGAKPLAWHAGRHRRSSSITDIAQQLKRRRYTAMELEMRSFNNSLRIVSRIGFVVLSALALTGCLNIPANPGVNPSIAGGIPDHSAFGTLACTTCHSDDRPAPTISAGTGAQVLHGGGRDCAE